APGGVEQMREGRPGYRLRLPQHVHPISAGIKGGIAGDVVMPVPALLWGLFSSHHSLWYPVNLLPGMVLPGLRAIGPPRLGRLHPVLAGVVGGLVGGAAMAVPAVLWAAASGHGFWYPVNLLAGMVLPGPGAVEAAQLGSFHAEWLVVAGAMHAVLSTGFGVLF